MYLVCMRLSCELHCLQNTLVSEKTGVGNIRAMQHNALLHPNSVQQAGNVQDELKMPIAFIQ